MVDENDHHADYVYKKLIELFGKDNVQYPYHFNIIFPKPSMTLAKKYQLMLTGDTATICILPNASKELLDHFIDDLKKDLAFKQLEGENV